MKSSEANSLCLECGFCCNGVIFADVRLQAGDDPRRLRRLGLIAGGGAGNDRRKPAGRGGLPESAQLKFTQPCAAFDGCRCRIYADRPEYCRAFECLLLKRARQGRVTHEAAVRLIRDARRRVERVRRLLRELGDADEGAALSLRFRQVRRRMEEGSGDEAAVATFGELTLAVHDLNVRLSESFYPGDCFSR